MFLRSLALALLASCAAADVPRGALPLDAPEWPRNYRLHLDGPATVTLADGLELKLEAPTHHDIAIEHPADGPPLLRVWSGGALVRGPEQAKELAAPAAGDFPDAGLRFGGDFTAWARFNTTMGGTIFSFCAPAGKWSPDAKALFIRDGRLVYDIGWLGEMSAGPRVNDRRSHSVLLLVREGRAEMWIDGKPAARKSGFTRPDAAGHVFKLGRAATDFGGDFHGGGIESLRLWNRALGDAEVKRLLDGDLEGLNTPDFSATPDRSHRPVVRGSGGWVQALERSDHAAIVSSWDDRTLKDGAAIYQSLCVICHGDHEKPGSLPTATRFASGELRNGTDPYSMYLTLTHGFGQMTAQPQFTTSQKYAVIHYIRETYFRPHQPSQLTAVTPDYLRTLPLGLARAEEEKPDSSLPAYERMELGNVLFWTLEIEPGNIAQKAIALRLDDGPGGVTRGRAWMTYDHDAMRLAAATTGGFVDWKGIAFDGSHGIHTRLTGDRHLVLPDGPAWSSGEDFADPRPPARDGKRYGPVPGIRYRGLHTHGGAPVLVAEIHDMTVLESPSWIDSGTHPVFVRTLNIGDGGRTLRLRVAPVSTHVVLRGDGTLARRGGFWVASLPPRARTRLFISRGSPADTEALCDSITTSPDLAPLTRGGPAKWAQTVVTRSAPGQRGGAFSTDDFPLPHDNPFRSWLRPGGFDFTPDGKGAIVAMWNGDVWRVDGIFSPAPAELRWRRIASGLFQPLGVKFRGDDLFITCRDQIVKLVDLNEDGESDFLECFNNDAQVTEHFHEFAMGLQTDAAGNLYYAKSGRHALDSVVPQHGTLLRVSADGSRTEIVATGFRAANGVCVNDDGSFFVTDQEGFWTPKNRINHVKPGGFYGNMYGYTPVTDTSDEAMEPPLVWVTNDKDRSPAELLRIPPGVWGALGGSLLNLSYGTGRAFIIPHEQVDGVWQGAVCELPMDAFATGIMRGRFGPDGALYTCGMFAWAGNATSPGGFHRIRPGTAPARVPVSIQAEVGRLRVTFSDPVEIPAAPAFRTWALQRSRQYGSKHLDERELRIAGVTLSDDRLTLTFSIPDLAPTHGYELHLGERVLHGTLHRLAR
jgi:mono/diheme cytochrome c family protein